MRILITFFLILTFSQVHYGQWELTTDFQGDQAIKYEVGNDKVYMLGENHIYNSDNGIDWTQLDISTYRFSRLLDMAVSGDSIMVLALNLSDNQFRYSLFFSKNEGLAWNEIPISEGSHKLVAFYKRTIALGGYNGLTFSYNFGTDWQISEYYKQWPDKIEELDNQKEKFILTGWISKKIFSGDLNFPKNNITKPNGVGGGQVHFAKNSILQFVTEFQNKGFIYRSEDDGITWELVFDKDRYYRTSDFFESEGKIYIYFDGFLVSSDEGKSWNYTSDPPATVPLNTPTHDFYSRRYTSIIKFNNTYLSGADFQSYSNDKGVTWNIGEVGFNHIGGEFMTEHKGDLYASSDQYALRRYDLSLEKWTNEDLLPDDFGARPIEEFQDKIFIGFNKYGNGPSYKDSIKYSFDKGKTWKNSPNDFVANFDIRETEKFINLDNRALLIIDKWDLTKNYFSVDGGVSWQEYNGPELQGFAGNYIFWIEGRELYRANSIGGLETKLALPNDNQALSLQTDNGVLKVYSNNSLDFYSYDFGETWHSTTSDISRIGSFAALGNLACLSSRNEIHCTKIQEDLHVVLNVDSLVGTKGCLSCISDLEIIGDYLYIGSIGSSPGIWRHKLNILTTLSSNITIHKSQDFKLYPNPANDFFVLEKSDHSTISGQMRITSAEGRVLKTLELKSESQVQIDVSGYSKGIYFIQVINDSGVVLKKVLIN